MEFPILSYIGAGPLRFGMSIAEIRAAIDCPVKPFLKGPNAVMFTAFSPVCVHAYYKPPGLCEALEFGLPSVPTLTGKRLLGVSTAEVQRVLRELDPQLQSDEDGVGFTSYALGVAIYSPAHLEFPDAPVEGVFVFERGYYERARGSKLDGSCSAIST